MVKERLEKYLKNYLDTVITPRLQKLSRNPDVKIYIESIRESVNIPGVDRIFLYIEPTLPQSFYYQLNDDIYNFFDMLGFENLPVIFWSDEDSQISHD